MKTLIEYINEGNINEALNRERFEKGGYEYEEIILTKDFNYMSKADFLERSKIRPGAYGAHKKLLKKFENLNWINSNGDIIIPKGTIMTCYDKSIDAYGKRNLDIYDFSLHATDSIFFLYPAHHDVEKFFKSVKLYNQK
jgi:hypothetical protein